MTFNEGVPDYTRLRPGLVTNEGLDQVDPNLVLINDYLAGHLAEDEEAALERRLETDAAFFNDVMPIFELVEALRVARTLPTHDVAEHTTARIELANFLALTVGAGATAVVVTPIGEVTLGEGTYTVDWTAGPNGAGGLRINREETSK